MSKFLSVLLLFASVGCFQRSVAQQPAAPVPVYDAVVIKANKTLSQSTRTDMDDTTFRATNVSLKHLLVNTYGIREGLISGLPAWAVSARYDVSAKVTEPNMKVLRNLSREQREAMLAAMLVERFHLQTHIELKTLPVYELVVAKDGPKLTTSAVAPPDVANPDAPGGGSMSVHNTEMTATGIKLSELAGNLSFPLERTVIDKTGLTGRYDFRLIWTADNVADAAAGSGAADAPPNLFTAIEQQLGLKLQAAKGPVKTLVVDHVEEPTEN
jgi:uncharacterized protein (TIGR03435 family)